MSFKHIHAEQSNEALKTNKSIKKVMVLVNKLFLRVRSISRFWHIFNGPNAYKMHT